MIKDTFFISIASLRSRKMRTFLTLLGVIIGTSSVIMVSTAGNSVKSFVEGQWNIFDPTVMIVGTGVAGDPPQISFSETVFTLADIQNIQNLPHVRDVAPAGIIPLKTISLKKIGGDEKPGGTMYASTPSILDILSATIVKGRVFEEGKNEVVISESFSTQFGKDKKLDVGDTIFLKKIGMLLPMKATIVGIFKTSGGSNILSQLTALSIVGPVDPYYTTEIGSTLTDILDKLGILPKKDVTFGLLYVTAYDKEHVEDVQNEILVYLNGQSDANNNKKSESDFVIITQHYIISKIEQVMNVINLFVTTIALISLIVGGIGIANIMFATVSERTKEIGTMMAIGAKKRYIMQLFLFQSGIIGLLGGIIGCIVGAAGSVFVLQVISKNLQKIGGTMFAGEIPLIYADQWFIIALISGLAVGIIAGVLPARKAAKMDPVVALRHE